MDPIAPVVAEVTSMALRTELEDLLVAIKAQRRQWRPPPRQDAHEILKHWADARFNIPAGR